MNWLERLTQIKKASGRTNEEIAVLSGVPKSTVDKLFSGQTKNPAYATVQAIVNCLGYPVDAIAEPYAKKALDKTVPEEVYEFFLKHEEADHIEKYRRLNDANRQAVDITIDAMITAQNDEGEEKHVG